VEPDFEKSERRTRNSKLGLPRGLFAFNPDYALELRREAFNRNKFKCFLDFGIAPFWLNQKTQQSV